MKDQNKSWVAWPLRNYKITTFIVILLLALGIYGITVMPKDEFPPFTIRQGVVVAVMPGATAQEIEEQVARPLERYIFTYPEVDRSKTYSTSSNGMVMIMVQFKPECSNLTPIWSKMKHGINTFKSNLPQGVAAVQVIDDFGDSSALLITVESDNRSYRELMGYSNELADRLRRLPSVSNVREYGEVKEQITINVDRARLAAYGIGQSSLMSAINGEGLTTMSGAVSTPTQNLNIHLATTNNSEQEIADRIIFSSPDGKVVRVRDVATVTREYDPTEPYIESNGKRCVILSLEMAEGNNIVKYGEDVDVVLGGFRSECLPDDVDMRRITDMPEIVGLSIHDFLRDLIISMIIIMVVMMILFPIRSAIVAAITIPISTFVAVGIMYAIGIPLNIITLASLIVALGMIVDNSIVVIDGYLEYLGKGMGKWDAAVKSVLQYFWPMMLATCCVCAIFYPILFTMTGEARDAVGFFPLTITINLMISLMVAACVIPLLNVRLIEKPKEKKEDERDLNDRIQAIYNRLINWNFNHPWLTIGGAMVLMCLSGVIFPFLKMRQFPFADQNKFAVEIYLPEGCGISETKVISDSLRDILLGDQRITGVTTFVGCSSPRFHNSYAPIQAGPNFAQFIVNTESINSTIDILNEYAPKYSNHWPDAYVRFKQMDYLPVPTYEYRFYGNNLDSIHRAADMLMSRMREMPELEWVHTDFSQPSPVLDVRLDPITASQLGISRTFAEIQLTMQTGKIKVGSIWESGMVDEESKTYELPIILKDSHFDNMEASDIQDIYLTTQSGKSVALRQLASVTPVWNETKIVHRNGERCISVLAEGKRQVLATPVQARIGEIISGLMLPQGVRSEIGGEIEKNNEMMPQIALGIGIALVLIFFFLLFYFRDFAIAIICIVAISLGMPGAMIGLLVANKVLGMTSMFGFITLMGMVMRNEILIFEHANDKMDAGMSARDAAMDAGKRRMIPIFLTTATTAVGVIPMILAGNSFWMPVGITIFSGGIGTLILTTTVLPVVYWKLREKNNS
ncbi:MAG: efflux RND transporter permease subunit [Bacteroidales bacterium]|nr:efflux RND transporter permease subunit [Bacteroidales bacterium]